MDIKLTPEQQKLYDTILKNNKASHLTIQVSDPEPEQEAPALEDRQVVEPTDPSEVKRELDGMYARLVQEAATRGNKRESTDTPPPSSTQGIVIDAAHSELARVARNYPELLPYIQKALNILKDGLVGGNGGRIIT